MCGPFFKKLETARKLKSKIAKMRFLLFTTEPGIRKQSDQKQHVISPISYLFFSAKNVKKQIIISDNVLLLYLYLLPILSLFLSRKKYLNPGFKSVVKSYLARQTKNFASPRCCKVIIMHSCLCTCSILMHLLSDTPLEVVY